MFQRGRARVPPPAQGLSRAEGGIAIFNPSPGARAGTRRHRCLHGNPGQERRVRWLVATWSQRCAALRKARLHHPRAADPRPASRRMAQPALHLQRRPPFRALHRENRGCQPRTDPPGLQPGKRPGDFHGPVTGAAPLAARCACHAVLKTRAKAVALAHSGPSLQFCRCSVRPR